MKKIDISQIDESTTYITREGKQIRLLNYVSQAHSRSKLLFLLEGNILGCDEEGKCWTVNNYDSSYTDTDFSKFDVFVDDRIKGYLNVYKEGKWFRNSKLYRTREEAKSNAESGLYKIIEVEWSGNE